MTSLWQRFLIDQQIEEESFLHKSFYIVLIVALLWYIWRQSNKKVINNPDDESIENDLLDNAYTEEDASQPEGRSRATTTERQYSAYNPKKTKSKKNAISAEQSLHYQFIKSLCKQSKRRILLTMVNQRKMKKQGKDITTEILGIRDEFMTLNNVASNNVINNDQILKICRCFVYTKGAESLHHIGWIIDETCPNCYVCSTKFTLFRRKHHCRKCGNIICKSCLVKSSITSKEKRMIVCKNCHEIRLLSNSSSFSFPVLGIKVSYLNKFIEEECGGIQNLKGLTILQVRDQYIKPLTYHCQTSFVELLKSEGGQSIDDIGIANIYISYAWNTEFLMIIETILNYFEKNAKMYENEMEPILWMDLFCINQFQKILQNIDHHWLSTHFLSSISQIHQTLLIMPTPPPVPVPLPAPHRPSLPVSSFSALIRSAPTNYNNNPHDRMNNNNNRNSPPPIAAVGPVVSNDEDEDEDEEDQQDNGHKGSGQELELVTGSGKRHPTNNNNNKTNPRRSSSHSPLLAADSSSSPSMKSQSIWENPTPFKRSWCLWELYCSFITSCKFQLVLSDEDAERFLEEIIMNEQDALSTLNKFLSAISTQSSQSYYIEDQKKLHAIFKEFTNYSLSNQILSYSLRNWFIHWITDNIQQEKDYHIKLKLKSFLILLFQEQKLFPAAEILLLELIEKKKKNLLQEDHIEIILEYIHLIYLYYKQKKFSLALTLALENYSKLKTILQEKHEITLNLYKMIAILYEHVGKYDLAEQYYLSYGIKLKNKFNNQEKNMEIMQFYEIVSKFYMKQGRFDLSESYLKQIYSFYKEIYPENSHPVLSIMSSLADNYLKRGNYIESQYFHEIVMEKRKVYFHLEQSNNNKENTNKDSGPAAATGGGGLSHQQYQYQVITLQSMQSLAKFYMKTFQFALAENIFHEVYLKSIDLFGENDLESIQCMLSFGLFYLEQNIFEKANDLLQRALHHVTELYGENHLVTFQIRYAIALIYERQMKLDISETLLLILLEKIYDYWNYYLFHHIHHHSGQGQHPTGGTRSSRVFSEASIADPSAFLSTNPEKLSSDPAVPSSGATLPPSSALSSQGMMMFRKNPTIIHILNNYDAEDHDETIITLYVQVINSIALNYQKQGKPDLAKQFFRVVLRQAFRPSPPAAANASNMNNSTKIISSAVTPAAIPASVLSSTFDHPPRSSDILMGDLSPTSSHHHQSSLLPPPSFIASGPGGERSSLSLLVHERMPSAIVNSPAPNANDGDEFNPRDSTVQPSKKRHGHHRGSPTPPVTTSALAASNNNSHRHQINPNDYENIFTIPAHHPDLLLICNNLANLYQMEGYYSLAEHYYKLVLNKCLIIFHELHIRIIACMINLGDLYLRQALYSLAESYYKKALEKLEMIQNLQPIQDHPHQDLLAAAAAIDPSFHPFPHHPNHPHAANPSGTSAGVVVVPVSPHLHAGPVAVTPVVPTEGIEIPTISNNNNNNNNNHPTSPHAHAHHAHAHHHFTPKNIRIPQHHFPYLLQQLAVLYEQIGKYELAERFLHNAFQYSEVIFGSEHPITSKLKIRLEEFRDQQGEHERLAFHRQRILEAYEETDI